MIKINKLTAALKTRSIVRWIKTDNHNYIMTDFFILKTNQEITGSALTTLIKVLGGIPQTGQGLECRYNIRKKLSQESIKSTKGLIEIHDARVINFTNLIFQSDKHLVSIFKAPDGYIYLNKIYVDLVNLYEEDIKILGNSRVSPVYFTAENETLMIVPIRVSDTPFYLKEEGKNVGSIN